MHIAIFCHNFPPHVGGLEAVVDELSSRLAERHRVTVVSTAFEGESGRSVAGNRTIWRLPALRLAEFVGVPYPLPFGPSIAAVIDELKSADIVHAHGALYVTSLLASYVARSLDVPLVVTEHVGFVRYSSRALNFIQRKAWDILSIHTIGTAAAVTTMNSAVDAFLLQQYPSIELRRIGNGVDVSRFVPVSADERRRRRRHFGLPLDELLVLFVGRDSSKKNLQDALRVAPIGFSLVVCGASRGLVRDGLFDLGIVRPERMPELLSCCDILLHPAIGEGFPIAVQEAMASGLPVVLRWDVGYDRSVSQDVICAYSGADSSEALTALLGSFSRREQLAASGRAWAIEHWSWLPRVLEYEQLYSGLIWNVDGRTGSK